MEVQCESGEPQIASVGGVFVLLEGVVEGVVKIKSVGSPGIASRLVPCEIAQKIE